MTSPASNTLWTQAISSALNAAVGLPRFFQGDFRRERSEARKAPGTVLMYGEETDRRFRVRSRKAPWKMGQ